MEENNLKADIPQAGEVESDLSNLQKSMPLEYFKKEIMVDIKVTPEPTAAWDGSELNQDR